jgi:hypothetical protein
MNLRTTKLPTRWLAVPALALVVLVAAGFVFEADSRTERPARVLVVVDASGGPAEPAARTAGGAAPEARLVARATAATRRADAAPGVEAQLRVTRTATEQLSVTHFFAARGYDAIVGVGLDRRVAVAPVASRYPATQFTLVGGRGLAAAVAAAAR